LKEGDHPEYVGIDGRKIVKAEERNGMDIECILLNKNIDQLRALVRNEFNLRVP
jgi:hypothetical protein